MTSHFSSFDSAYKSILRSLLTVPQFRTAPRGMKIYEIMNFSYCLDNLDNPYIDFRSTAIPERQETYDSYAKRELDWYLSGDLAASSAPSKFWLKLADAAGNITSNYGFMMMHDAKYPTVDAASQQTAVDRVVELLKQDLDSRQAVLHYSEPRHCWPGNKDVPCTVAAQVMVRNGELHMAVFQRSCDVIKGLSYDVPWHIFLIKHLAEKVGVKAGTFTHFVGSLHMYETDFSLAEKIISGAVQN